MENLEIESGDLVIDATPEEKNEDRFDRLEREMKELRDRQDKIDEFIDEARKTAVEQLWEQNQSEIKKAWVAQVLGENNG